MPKLKISNRAERDLAEIGRYIAKDSPVNAFLFIQKLKNNLRILATQPMAGRARDELSPGLRSVFYCRYIIFIMQMSKPWKSPIFFIARAT